MLLKLSFFLALLVSIALATKTLPVVQSVTSVTSASSTIVTVRFGTLLCSKSIENIPVGPKNNFGALGENLGQAINFYPGWNYTGAAVNVTLNNSPSFQSGVNVSWKLGDHTATFFATTSSATSFVPVVYGNDATLCTQPSTGALCSDIYTPPHPFAKYKVVSQVPRATADVQNLKGKNCVVIGGCRGLGRTLAQAYYAAGCNVLATSRQPLQYASLTQPACHPAWVDVTKQGSIDAFFDLYVSLLPSLDIVHYNPGIGSFGGSQFMRSQDLRQAVDNNCLGLTDVAFRSYPLMNLTANPYSKFFVTGSTSSYQATTNLLPYTLSKTCIRVLMWEYNTDQVLYRQLSGVPSKPPMVLIAPTGMATGWGVYEYFWPSSQITATSQSVALTRDGFLFALAGSQPPAHVAEGTLNIALLPSTCVEWSYNLADIYSDPSNPLSDSGSQDIEYSQVFNLSEKESLTYYVFNTSLTGFAFAVDLHDAVRTNDL
jgi:hypothetical protein